LSRGGIGGDASNSGAEFHQVPEGECVLGRIVRLDIVVGFPKYDAELPGATHDLGHRVWRCRYSSAKIAEYHVVARPSALDAEAGRGTFGSTPGISPVHAAIQLGIGPARHVERDSLFFGRLGVMVEIQANMRDSLVWGGGVVMHRPGASIRRKSPGCPW